HDHSQCVSTALAEADALCARQGVRLTELRRRVLELVWQSHKPLGAYDILAVLSETDGRRAAPPTVYRALDFLQENGLVHRIASLNAFVGCNNPEHSHQGQFLICRTCHTAIELEQPDISRAIVAGANSVGFAVESQTVEVVGLCGTCRDQKDA
ncbi:TPA: zinc uptake transcriptional repressor Zur, partial [Pseudomonas aeruginosa]|nr:zinc uptake transcriptional repressor Zur [Pseudomonas aeruginosa]